jgi:DNA-binding SARP family transcriptional activator/tetratricopeptide (TPR) repeat protein
MLFLRTFGGAAITADDGVPLDGAASQRRLLALLSLLAVAGEAGLTRDRLIGLLWPEGDPLRVRHALTQSLYQARRALHCDDLFLAGADIRLNPLHIISDVERLESLLGSGDLLGAAHLYRGPFLDGFFISGNGEFEQWVTKCRDRYATRLSAAFEKLAASHEERGDWIQSAEWRERVVDLDPLSALARTRLMTALARSGDRAMAIHHAKVHSALIRERLDLDPDESVEALARTLRRSSPTVGVSANEIRTAELATTPKVTPASRRGGWGQSWVARSGLVAAAAAIGLVFVSTTSPSNDELPVADVSDVRTPIVVMPFRVDGADPALAYLREGMMELLSTRFVDDTLGRSIDPGAVLTAWHRLPGGPDTRDLSRSAATEFGKRLGAGRLLTGSIIGTPAHLVVSASLISAERGHAPIDAAVEGPADSVTVLVDRLAAKLLAESAGERERLAARLTDSLPALRAFLIGQQSFRRGDFAAAVSQYERAIGGDSTFGIAAFQLALAADHLNDAEQHDRALALAWANRGDLTTRDLAHLVAFAGPRYPAPSTKSEELAAWNQAVEVSPDRADVWFELGDHLYHDGSVVGVDSARAHSARAFARALELDPDDRAGARAMLILSAARTNDTVLLTRYADARALGSMREPKAPFVRWRLAIARGDSDNARRIRDNLPELSDANLRLIAMASLQDGVDIPTGLDALSQWASRHAQAEALDALLAQHAFALNQGRTANALAIADRIRDLQPGMHTDLRIKVLDAIYGEGDAIAGESAATELDKSTALPARTNIERGLRLADLCVLEQWRLAHDHNEAARATIVRLRAAPLPRTLIAVSANQRACALMLDAWLAVNEHSPAAERKVAALNSVTLSGPAMSDAANYSNILLSRLYDRLGHSDRAFAAIRRHTYMSGWPRYLATSEREHSRLATLAGDPTEARTMYDRYLALRTSVPAVAVARQTRRRGIFRRRFRAWP